MKLRLELISHFLVKIRITDRPKQNDKKQMIEASCRSQCSRVVLKVHNVSCLVKRLLVYRCPYKKSC